MSGLRAPFPYFGGKSMPAPRVWEAFGDTPNYVEPFFGSGATLLARPRVGKIETVNDLNADIANFWRATQHAPDEVAHFADQPVNEVDLHAWHKWLVDALPAHRERMLTEPEYFDAKRAGVWVWGQSCWIGSGWADGRHVWRKRPLSDKPGRGVHQRAAHPPRQMPNASTRNGVHARMPSVGHSGRGIVSPEAPPLFAWFEDLRARLRHVRVLCGDFTRVLSGAVTGASNTLNNSRTPCAVFLDPPYLSERTPGLYGEDSKESAERAYAWAKENGSNSSLRIALCGYDGDYELPGWSVFAWKSKGGFGNKAGNRNGERERIWFSPHCLPLNEQQTLFGSFDDALTDAT